MNGAPHSVCAYREDELRASDIRCCLRLEILAEALMRAILIGLFCIFRQIKKLLN